MKELTSQKVLQYLSISTKALKKAKICVPKKTHLHTVALDVIDMVERYLSDAKHFFEKEDYVNAFAAINYAHGWLDAGARLGLFDVGHDSTLFTVE